eukprot:5689057-Amphidinium_carterae.1
MSKTFWMPEETEQSRALSVPVGLLFQATTNYEFCVALTRKELRPPALVRFFSDALGQGRAEDVICGTVRFS